ncbi:hypothetical protein BJY01DRAFT_230413 [Aspergillus pseudoustus]|uniref:Uncharacterized protein n=1 Tax=Aspergillus pseudoustus TaxID=1810923 RepID=A0ABR4IAD3_9EURO
MAAGDRTRNVRWVGGVAACLTQGCASEVSLLRKHPIIVIPPRNIPLSFTGRRGDTRTGSVEERMRGEG